MNIFKTELVKESGIFVHVTGKNLTNQIAAKEVFDELKTKKIQVDYLINNVGFDDFGVFSQSDRDRQLEIIDLNIKTLTCLTHLLLPE